MPGPAERLRKRYTWQDYRTWDGDQRWEIIDREPFAMSPAPSVRHHPPEERIDEVQEALPPYA